jgi:rhodanese-related sulfurtransferase
MSDVVNVSVEDLGADAKVLDVREDYEWNAGHIEGAVHIPLGELPERLGELDPDTEYRGTCLRGGRSLRAVEWLNAQGYEAVNVEGGMAAWGAANKPIVSETGETPYIEGH